MKILKSNSGKINNREKAWPSRDALPTQVALISDIHPACDDDYHLLSRCLENICQHKLIRQVVIVGGLAGKPAQTRRTRRIIDSALASNPRCHAVVMQGNQSVRGGKNGLIEPDLLPPYGRCSHKAKPPVYPETQCVDYWLNGYHFIVLNSDRGGSEPMSLSAQSLDWLQRCLAWDARLDRPIFVMIPQALSFTHRQTAFCDTSRSHHEKMKDIFEHYPQLVVISGHTHNGFGTIEIMQRSFGTLVEVPSLTATEQGEKRKGTGWLLKIDSDSLIFEAWDFYRHQPLAAFHHKVSLPQLPVLVKKIASWPDNIAQPWRTRADRLLYRVYQNNLPLPGRSVTVQKGYPGDKLYNVAVWKTIQALRKDILKGVNGGEKVAVPTCGPGITACFNKDQAELIYVEHDAPNWDDEAHLDYIGYYFNLGERGGFAGIQRQKDPIIGNFSSPCHALCIIGEVATAKSVTENAVQLEWTAENTLAIPLGGSDTGRRIAHPMPWHADIRYATVLRRWYVAGERRTHLAMFSYAFANGTWTHYFSASVPGADISFSSYQVVGLSDRFSGDEVNHSGHEVLHLRMDENGQWEQPAYRQNAAVAHPPYRAAALMPLEAHIQLAAGDELNNTHPSQAVYPRQSAAKPISIAKPKIMALAAKYEDGILTIEWRNDESTSPQLHYHVEVRRQDLEGELIARQSAIIPQQRKVIFDTLDPLPAGEYYFTLVIESIFNTRSALHYDHFTCDGQYGDGIAARGALLMGTAM